jgi:hypothetical protein
VFLEGELQAGYIPTQKSSLSPNDDLLLLAAESSSMDFSYI